MGFLQKKLRQDETWMPVSDMMAGLMMVFIIIAVFYAQTLDEKYRAVTAVVDEIQDTESNIYWDLRNEFEDDLERWHAEIDEETLTVRFLAPRILFPKGKSQLQPEFQEILLDFMPRYIKILQGKYSDEIDEVRIEGHTSSEWEGNLAPGQDFIKNMELSQARTRNVLEFTMSIPSLKSHSGWMVKKLSANGLSSSKLILQKDGKEDPQRSRRVEFTVKTKTRERLYKMIDEQNLRSLRKI